jgi:hypothetical protein
MLGPLAKQVQEKLKAENLCGEQISTSKNSARPSLREEAEVRVGYHRSEADKNDRAAAFFRENPVFDEFIRLIRSGAINI